MPSKQLKPPLGQSQERFDIKKGLSRKMASHQNEKNTWWNTLNFRFYKQNIFSFLRKSLYSTLVPVAQALTIPTNSCQIQTHPPLIPVVSSSTITVAPSSAVSYQIIASGSPFSYGSGTLPGTLTLDTSTGLITGDVPATITSYVIPISATNSAGTGNGTLTINVKSTLSVTFDELFGTGVSSLQVAFDGGSYAPVSYGSPYTFSSQLKTKYSLSGTSVSTNDDASIIGTITNSGSRTVAAGSSVNLSATVVSGSAPATQATLSSYLFLNGAEVNYLLDFSAGPGTYTNNVPIISGAVLSSRIDAFAELGISPGYTFNVNGEIETIININ